MKNLYLAVLLIATLFSGFATAEVAVIVHPSNADTISQNDVSDIFLGKTKSFPGGSSVVPIVLNDATVDEFNTKLLGKSSSQLQSYWSKLVFTGKANPPKSVSSAEMIELIKSNPNMIGFVDSANLTADLKVVGKY
jgi:ABC-type phosphate transport system substrate-binding protein|tara:strand:- start:6152 stop:6559 length:408 start_codon:yes stop_codon:yes gene_type:complete